MKRFFVVLFIVLLCGSYAVAGCVTQTIASAPGASGTFTSGVSPYTVYTTTSTPENGQLNVSIYGSSWDATVFLQRSFDSGVTWYDITTFTANIETQIRDASKNVTYRLGVKNAGYSSGSVLVQICW